MSTFSNAQLLQYVRNADLLNNPPLVLTGGPNSGKTTLLATLKDIGYATIREPATAVIKDEGVEIVNEWDRFHHEILKRQIAEELVARNQSLPVFADRSVLDIVAYYRHYGRCMPADLSYLFSLIAASRRSRPLYELVFVLDTIPRWEDNGVRKENLEFSHGVQKTIIAVYREFGIPLVRVPVMPVRDRTLFVLSKINAFNDPTAPLFQMAD